MRSLFIIICLLISPAFADDYDSSDPQSSFNISPPAKSDPPPIESNGGTLTPNGTGIGGTETYIWQGPAGQSENCITSIGGSIMCY
jgi:hypothetical protein